LSIIALDTETEEFDKKAGITPHNAKMLGLSIAYDDTAAEYVTDPARWPLMMPKSDATVVVHKAVFDFLKFVQTGLPVPEKFEDTKLAAFLIDENRNTSLKPLAKELLGVESVNYKDVDRDNEEEFAKYARNDSLWTRRLWLEKFQKEIEQQELQQVYDLEKSVIPVVLSMESKGMLVDRDRLEALAKTVADKLAECNAAVDGLLLKLRLKGEAQIPADFNVNSTKQLAELLYGKQGLNLKCHKYTKKKAKSVDTEALTKLDHPLAKAIIDQREFQKLATAFTEKLPKHIEADGRIRPSFNQMGAATGRFSCSNPNLQQVPAHSDLGRQLRDCFMAPPGRKLVVADYSQMELRVLAHYSRDSVLLEAFNRDEDLHVKTAAKMLGKKPVKIADDPEGVTDDERFIAKMINFGIVYGLTPMGLYNRLQAEGMQVTEEECEKFVELYFQTYPGVRSFLNRVKMLIQTKGFVKTLYGRRRRLSGRYDREVRQAQNFVIQGSAADLCKKAMVDIHRDLPEDCFIIAMIHDELIVECPDELAETCKEIVVSNMKKVPYTFRVPIKVDAHIANRWGEAKG
jgi:DNA polymerase-1